MAEEDLKELELIKIKKQAAKAIHIAVTVLNHALLKAYELELEAAFEISNDGLCLVKVIEEII